MADVTLSKAVRSNLLHLQNTARLMDVTQERLATGLKVNSALDNPTNFFTAASLNSRAADIATLLDAMSNGIQTLEAADNGLSSITSTIESMQSTLRQARQDKNFQSTSYPVGMSTPLLGTEMLNIAGGALPAGAGFDVDLTTSQSQLTAGAYTAVDFANGGANDGAISFEIAVHGGEAQTITVTHADVAAPGGAADPAAVTADELAAIINAKLDNAGVAATATVAGGALTFTTDSAAGSSVADITISGFAVANGAGGSGLANGTGTVVNTAARSVDALVNAINADPDLKAAVRASNDNGKLRIQNLSTQPLTLTGLTDGTINGGIGQNGIDGNDNRASLARQFNELRTELDRLAEDASYSGINLLRGDQLKIVFNESGTSTIEIQAKNAKGEVRAINVSNLGLLELSPEDLDSDENIDALLSNVQLALNEVRAQASDLGSTLSVVQNRENFTKEMINTLQTGASNLTLADGNEEAANMLALQTRQQLSQTALSLASQADQAILRLFG